jgi:hypothetical protein
LPLLHLFFLGFFSFHVCWDFQFEARKGFVCVWNFNLHLKNGFREWMNKWMNVCVCVLGASIWNKKGIWKKIIACCRGLRALGWSKITMQSECEFETPRFVKTMQQSLEASHVSFFFYFFLFFMCFFLFFLYVFLNFFYHFKKKNPIFNFYFFLCFFNKHNYYNLVHFAYNLRVNRS